MGFSHTLHLAHRVGDDDDTCGDEHHTDQAERTHRFVEDKIRTAIEADDGQRKEHRTRLAEVDVLQRLGKEHGVDQAKYQPDAEVAPFFDRDGVVKWGYLGIGLIFGLINSVLFTESLKYVNFGEASAVFFALTVIGLYGSSYFIFHEPVSSLGLIGVVLITAGVIIISYSMSKVKGV